MATGYYPLLADSTSAENASVGFDELACNYWWNVPPFPRNIEQGRQAWVSVPDVSLSARDATTAVASIT